MLRTGHRISLNPRGQRESFHYHMWLNKHAFYRPVDDLYKFLYSRCYSHVSAEQRPLHWIRLSQSESNPFTTCSAYNRMDWYSSGSPTRAFPQSPGGCGLRVASLRRRPGDSFDCKGNIPVYTAADSYLITRIMDVVRSVWVWRYARRDCGGRVQGELEWKYKCMPLVWGLDNSQ